VSLDCLRCGACCAYSATWPALIGDGDGADIPDDLIDPDRGQMLCHGNRCAALAGEIGIQAQCSVYANRPLVCREFQAGSVDCLMVRRSYNLPTA